MGLPKKEESYQKLDEKYSVENIKRILRRIRAEEEIKDDQALSQDLGLSKYAISNISRTKKLDKIVDAIEDKYPEYIRDVAQDETIKDKHIRLLEEMNELLKERLRIAEEEIERLKG